MLPCDARVAASGLLLLLAAITGCAAPGRREAEAALDAPVERVTPAQVDNAFRRFDERKVHDGTDERLRRRLAQRLLAIPGEEASALLLTHRFWLEDEDQAKVIERWAREGTPASLARIDTAAERNDEAAARWLVARALAAPASERRASLDALWETHPRSRRPLSPVLLARADEAAVADFLVAHFDELSAESRHALVLRFRSTLEERFVGLARRAVFDHDRDVRDAAIKALEEHAKRDAIATGLAPAATERESEDLMLLLESPKRAVVIGAVRSLGALRCARALPRLVRLLEQDDRELAEAVHEAICKIDATQPRQ